MMVYDTDLKDMFIFNGFWKRATIGEVPIALSGSADNLGILSGSNSGPFGIGLQGDANTGTGVFGITDSGVGVRGNAAGTGIAGRFLAASGSAISVVNTSNTQATARISNTTVGATALEVTGKMTLQTDINGSAISASNNNAAVGSIGVRGTSVGGFGVSGESASGYGVGGESQTGRGVRGVSNSGIGVEAFSTSNQAFYGNNNSASNPTARFDNMASGGNALHLQGGIKVSGSSPAALRLEASNDVFSMPIPTTSANAQTDLIFVTRATGISGGTSTSYYAKWTGSDWEIRREDNGTITAGTNLNVLIIKQ
jgi:hypothetical protein